MSFGIVDVVRIIKILKGKGDNVDKKALVTDLLLAFLRHALTGGGLLGLSLSDSDMAKVAAVIPVVIGSALSAWDKLKKQRQLQGVKP